ncbi:MAG: hypothetical protein AB7S41_11680 [Parvibaculaceae bacterium]
MTNTKWLRRALLGGVALSVTAAGAQADELTDLKAQLESLQARVGQLESQPAQPALPEGVSLLTFNRGQGSLANWGNVSKRDGLIPDDRGFTINVTPTADIPAPVAEVVVYGYVKGDVIYDFNDDAGDAFYIPNLWANPNDTKEHVRIHARQTRFGIKSKVDTAVGQIRTLIEGDFFSANNAFRLRHAWGEWDMTPYWTLGVGQYWQTAALLPIGISTVDFTGESGPFGYTRRAQVRLTYHDGPISWAVAIERPTFTSDAQWPNVSAYFQYDAAGGHQFIVTGTIADWSDPIAGLNAAGALNADHNIGWAVQAGANINLGDIATFTVGAAYGDQEVCAYLNNAGAWCFNSVDTDQGGALDWVAGEGWGVGGGFIFNVSDTTTVNVGAGWSHLENGTKGLEGIDSVDVYSAHGNVLWQPVKQMRLGWEVMYGKYKFDAGAGFNGAAQKKDDDVRAQFGAWFFF